MFYAFGINATYILPDPESRCFRLFNKEPGFVRMFSGTRFRAKRELIPLSGVKPRGRHFSEVALIPKVRGPT